MGDHVRRPFHRCLLSLAVQLIQRRVVAVAMTDSQDVLLRSESHGELHTVPEVAGGGGRDEPFPPCVFAGLLPSGGLKTRPGAAPPAPFLPREAAAQAQ